jgi:hypothetical protein
MSLQVIDRFHPRQRNKLQVALNAGKIQKQEEFELLDEQQLRPLAVFSMQLLGLGALFFGVLNLVIYAMQTHRLFPPVTFWGFVLWLVLNIIGYMLILPIHELIHWLTFVFWGGKPFLGAKLPLALFCGAKDQLFRRNQYLIIGLAPLVAITVAGIILTILSPTLASYSLLATIGNVSGASGDVWVVERLARLSKNVLVEDTESGYRVWEVSNVL